MRSSRRRIALTLSLTGLSLLAWLSSCGGAGSSRPAAPLATHEASSIAPALPVDGGDASAAVAVTEAQPETFEDAAVAEVVDAGPFGWLPAITVDGRKVAFAQTEQTGPMVTQYFAVEVREVARDRVGPRYVVHGGEDPEKPGHDARVASTLRTLGRDRWTTLTQYDVHEDPAAPERQGGMGIPFRANMAVGEGLTVRYLEPVLTVTDEKGRELLRRSVPTYSRMGGMLCKGCVNCPPWLAHLRDVHGSRAKRTLLLEIEYRGGTDSCWEPPPATHVVSF